MQNILDIYIMKTKQNNLNYQTIENVQNILKFKDNFQFPMNEHDKDDHDELFEVQYKLESFLKDFNNNHQLNFLLYSNYKII